MLVILLGLSVPLGSTLFRQFSKEKWSRVKLERVQHENALRYFQEKWQADVREMRLLRNREGITAKLELARSAGLSAENVIVIADYLRQITGKPVVCEVSVVLVTRAACSVSRKEPSIHRATD